MGKNIIRPLLNLEMELPLGWFTYLFNFNKTCQANGYIWYIEGPKEKMVVDCGGKSETILQYGFPAKKIATPEEALNKIGLSCNDIDTVIVTHIDPDHIEEAKRFTKAKFLIQKDELEFARNPHPLFQMRYPAEWIEGLNYEVLDGDTQIAEGVQVIKTAGHSPGGQSVVVDTAEGKAVIAGFCSVQDNFNPPEEIKMFRPVIIPALHCDVFQLYESVIRVKELADIIIPNHAPEFATRDRIP
jgi:glyoxylase-like metal-dependent hydrolase (beta-lactamase superfamily II)